MDTGAQMAFPFPTCVPVQGLQPPRSRPGRPSSSDHLGMPSQPCLLVVPVKLTMRVNNDMVFVNYIGGHDPEKQKKKKKTPETPTRMRRH